LLLGPYSYLAGATALDFGGRRGGATACGVIDGVGYLGGASAGEPVARLVQAQGWPTAFGTMTAVALAAATVAAVFLVVQARASSGGGPSHDRRRGD
jgi:OPA family glycerol-3-phosphate transporter-like MFS transporter